jgi:hypothetical protein
MQAVIEAAHVLRRPIAELTAQDVEMWAGGRMIKQLQAHPRMIRYVRAHGIDEFPDPNFRTGGECQETEMP